MKWEIVRLGDYCIKIGSGATPKGGATVYIEDGVTLIRSQNVYNLFFEYDGLTHITDDAAEKLNGVTIFPDDILLNITGDSVARVCMVPTDVLPARVNQHVAIIRTRKDLLPQYLLYYLASPYMQAYMLNLAVGKGASRNALTKGMIEDFPMPLPSVEGQRRIIEILSPYSNLIKNNQKQIKLLEEAAQRLYKEWFVDLRFPGHETTPIVDGVPEGWTRCCLENVISFNPKVSLSKERLKQSVPMSALSTTSMILDFNEFTTTYSNAGSKFQNGDTLLARITPCLENGKTAFVSGIESSEGAVGSTEYIVMREKEINPYMVYLLARTEDFRQAAINSMTGSDGRQRAQVDKLKTLPYLKPTIQVMELFARCVEPMFIQIQTKNRQNMELKQARDSLLPKLMSGEIEV